MLFSWDIISWIHGHNIKTSKETFKYSNRFFFQTKPGFRGLNQSLQNDLIWSKLDKDSLLEFVQYVILNLDETDTFVVGGSHRTSSVNIDLDECESIEDSCFLPNLPYPISDNPSLFKHGRDILLCGGEGNEQTCLKLQNHKWSPFNNLLQKRIGAAVVQMKDGVYIFGGYKTGGFNTSEFLTHDSDVWEQGPDIPYGFQNGCGVRISDTELLLIGGEETANRVLKLNVQTNTWEPTSISLHQGRKEHSCILFQNKIIVTKGMKLMGVKILKK